ncbi:MAG: hypothetical protein OXF41_21950 [bacterium]|nr:hypothetical protein [bacterium]
MADLERSQDFYHGAFGYLAKGTGVLRAEDDGGRVGESWMMPDGMTARFAVVGPARCDSCLLRIVEFDAPGQPIWDDLPAGKVIGHYALNIRVPEIHTGWERIVAAGGRIKSPPTHWHLSDGSAWDSQIYDPDGILIDAWSVEGEIAERLGAAMDPASELQTMALHVGDAVRSKEFYLGFGYGVLYDQQVKGLEEFFGVPDGVVMHNVNLIMEHTPVGRMEMSQYLGHPGIEVKPRAVPPNHGILSVTFEAGDLPSASAHVVDLGAEPIGGPATYAVLPYGQVAASTFFGPDGEMVEIFERIG